jgi:hypothetical protein
MIQLLEQLIKAVIIRTANTAEILTSAAASVPDGLQGLLLIANQRRVIARNPISVIFPVYCS